MACLVGVGFSRYLKPVVIYDDVDVESDFSRFGILGFHHHIRYKLRSTGINLLGLRYETKIDLAIS